MRYSQLKAFHNVALYGGFSIAAEAVFLTQPVLSEQVRQLEQEYDVLLFQRKKKRVRLTEEGVLLFNLTKRFFEDEQQIREFLSEKRAVMEGTLRIIVDSASHIADTLSRFRNQYPEVFVSIRTGNTEEMLGELRAYNVEIAVAGSIDANSDLGTIELGSAPIVAVAAKGYLAPSPSPLSLRQLAKLPLVFREQGSKTRQKLEAEAIRQKISLIPAIEVEGREAMREIVASGSGIGFVSEAEFGNDKRLVKIPVKGANLRMTETLAYLLQRKNLSVIRAFIDFVNTNTPRKKQRRQSIKPD